MRALLLLSYPPAASVCSSILFHSSPVRQAQGEEDRSRRSDNRTKRTRDEDDEDEDSDEDSDESSEDDADDGAPIQNRNNVSKGKKASKEDIRKMVLDLGDTNNGNANVTGLVASLKAKKLEVSIEMVRDVLKELERADKISLDGDDFYIAT